MFGSFINTFDYLGFTFSFNLTYKFGYFFRRLNVFSGSNYSNNYRLADYDKRWQKSGDEFSTSTPSLIYPANTARDSFYQLSDVLVEKGDHIRLQDIKFSYRTFGKTSSIGLFKNTSIFLYAQNLGLIWRATTLNIDPDYGTYNIPQPIAFSAGISFKL